MKAILIDPVARTVTEVDADFAGDYRQISAHLGREYFTAASSINRRGDVLFVDDDGLFKPDQQFFLWGGLDSPLAGRGLILGSDSEGDTAPPWISLESVALAVRWIDPREAVERHNSLTAVAHAEAAIFNAMHDDAFIIVSSPVLGIDEDGKLATR